MKKKLLSLAAILSIGFFTSNLEAQTSTYKTVTTNAGARLIQPMTLTQESPLYFGTISVLTGALGSVTLNPKDAVRTFINTADGFVGAPATTPTYSVTGTKNATYAVSLPQNGTITVTEIGTGASGETMAIQDFVASFGSSDDKAITNKLSSGGADSFKVGATLVVKDGQATGIYAGTFPVTVDYN